MLTLYTSHENTHVRGRLHFGYGYGAETAFIMRFGRFQFEPIWLRTTVQGSAMAVNEFWFQLTSCHHHTLPYTRPVEEVEETAVQSTDS